MPIIFIKNQGRNYYVFRDEKGDLVVLNISEYNSGRVRGRRFQIKY